MFDTMNSPNRNMAIVKAVRHQGRNPVASKYSAALQDLRRLVEPEREVALPVGCRSSLRRLGTAAWNDAPWHFPPDRRNRHPRTKSNWNAGLSTMSRLICQTCRDSWQVRWRRDLNPRLGVTQQSLSRRSPSAARTRHRVPDYGSAPERQNRCASGVPGSDMQKYG